MLLECFHKVGRRLFAKNYYITKSFWGFYGRPYIKVLHPPWRHPHAVVCDHELNLRPRRKAFRTRECPWGINGINLLVRSTGLKFTKTIELLTPDVVAICCSSRGDCEWTHHESVTRRISVNNRGSQALASV